MKSVSKKILFFVSLFWILSLSGCSSNKGERVLIAQFRADDSSNAQFVKETLRMGGEITLNVETAREIDPDFDNKYAVSDKDGKFLTRPALINFIAGNGWNFKQTFCINMNSENQEFYFSKSR